MSLRPQPLTETEPQVRGHDLTILRRADYATRTSEVVARRTMTVPNFVPTRTVRHKRGSAPRPIEVISPRYADVTPADVTRALLRRVEPAKPRAPRMGG